MTEERRVLYALVAAGFLAVVAVLIVGAAASGLVDAWWTVTASAVTVGLAAFGGIRWRKTGMILGTAILWFVVWSVITLAVR